MKRVLAWLVVGVERGMIGVFWTLFLILLFPIFAPFLLVGWLVEQIEALLVWANAEVAK